MVRERCGSTEGRVDLVGCACFKPAGGRWEVTNPDGTMARLPELSAYAQQHDIVVISIEDIVAYRGVLQLAAE